MAAAGFRSAAANAYLGEFLVGKPARCVVLSLGAYAPWGCV